MPIFDNELIDNVSDRSDNEIRLPQAPLGSPVTREINTNMGGNWGSNDHKVEMGLSLDELANVQAPTQRSFDRPFSSVSAKTLLDNKRYPMYERDVDLENIYGLQQSWYTKLGHSLVKAGVTATGTFAQSLTDIPNTISALKNGSMSDLAGDPDGYEGSIDNWIKNFEDVLPNYMTREEKAHPYLAMIPFAPGSANFWGESVIKNLGFTAGAIAGAVVQDAAIGFVTEGIGAVPLFASQIGKAALWMNKIAGGTNKVDKVLDLAKTLGKSEKQILKIQQLGNLAQSEKVLNGARYGIISWGAAQTESGVEARDGYRHVKEELIQQYKDNNFGEEPIGQALQEIEDYSTDAMNTRFGINMALLTVSNAVQFDNLFKSFTTAQKNVTGSLTRSIGESGKVGLKEGSFDVFEKKSAAGIKDRVWDFVKPKLPNVLSEGVYEEGGQFAAERGTYDYYTRKYKNLNNPVKKQNWDDLKEITSSTTYGLSEQFNTTEGINNMIVGGLTAMLIGGGQQMYDYKKGQGKDARLNSSVNMLNRYGMTGILSDKYDNTLNSIGIAKEMNEAAKSGDIFRYKNLKNDMFFNFVQSRIPSGMHDVTIEQLKMLKDLDREDFQKTFGMDFTSSNQKTVSGYVDSLIEKANDINKTSEAINSTFKNPFTSSTDPKTPEAIDENANHDTFENWKTDLTYYASIKDDVNHRLDSIQDKVSQINPLIDNDTLASITDKDSLKELSRSYEERANQLNKTITDYTTPADKKATREQVKALRTQSEKINIALNGGSLDLKTFHSLLNFELNNQDGKKEDVVGLENASELYVYGADINKNSAYKKLASEIFDNLSAEEGFDKYFKQAKDIANNQVAAEEADETVTGATFVNSEKKQEPLEVNREYEVKATKKASINKIAEDRYEVIAPDGTSSFHKTEEQAKEEAKDLTDENTNLSKVKVLATNEDGTVKVEDVNGDILNIDPSRLQGYAKIKTQEEKLGKDKEVIDAEQDKLELSSADVETTFIEPGEYFGSEDQRKDVDILFLSSTSASEDTAGEYTNNLPHVKRSRKFLNNAKFSKNRPDMKVIIVTPNNAKQLGLEGIVQLSFDKQIGDTLTEDETNVEMGFMAQVYILQTPEGNFFVDVDGNAISEVGVENPTILDHVIFQTMTSASLYTEGGYAKARAGQEVEAAKALEAYKIFREDVFAQEGYTPYSFAISRGIARQNKINDVYEDNHMSDILGPDGEDIISNQDGLLNVVTTGKFEHNGELLTFTKGTTLINYGDLLDFANNKNVTNKQAGNIFAVIDALAKDLIEKSNSGKPVKLNYNYSKFLQNVLFWRSKADTSTPSQIGIDTNTMEFKIGDKSFPLSAIPNSRKEIMDALQDAFITVNNRTLEEGTSKKFTEYVVDKDGALKRVIWKNYQTYLLSSKNPDGSSRSTEDTPLITHTAKPTDNNNAYKQKYTFITDKEVLPYDRVPVKEEIEEEIIVEEDGDVVGEYKLDNKKVNTSNIINAGPISFIGKIIKENGESIVEVEILNNDTITKLSTERPLINAIDSNLSTIASNPVTEANVPDDIKAALGKDLLLEEKAKLFANIKVSREIIDLANAPKQAAPKAKPQPAPAKKDRKTEIKEKLSSIKGTALGFRISELTPGTSRWTENGTKITFEKSQRDKYNRGNEIFTWTHTDGTISSIFVDRQQRPSKGFSDENELPFEASYLENPKPLLDELATLEKVPAEEEVSDEEVSEDKPFDSSFNFGNKKGPSEFREKGKDSIDRMTNSELEAFKLWHAEKVPFIPFEILENIIERGDIRAWGVFEDGVAKFVRGGLKGTEYHEIFEAIWSDFLTETEKNNLLTEFRNKKGEFTDRQSGKKYDYSDPYISDKIIKERIADDFADFRLGKLEAISLGQAIRNFFMKIVDFFKAFIINPSLKNQLFNAIDSGKFKETKLSERAKSMAPEYRAIEGLSEKATNEFIQDMVAKVKLIIFREGRKDLLFNPEKLTGEQVFNQVKEEYESVGAVDALGEKRYNELVKRSIEFLRTTGITFNAEDVISINDENANGREYAQDTFSVDWKKHSTGALKFLLSTLTERKALNQTKVEKGKELKIPDYNFSDIGGLKLLNFNRVFATLLDRLHNTNDPAEFTNKLIELAKEDSNYLSVFAALGGNRETHTFDFGLFKESDWRLFIQFFNTFTRQKPEALIQYISEEGDVYTNNANIFTIVKQTTDSWINNMKVLGKAKSEVITYGKNSKNENVYKINTVAIAGLPIKKSNDMLSFLNKLGVEFSEGTYNALSDKETIVKGKKTSEVKLFTDAVDSIHTYLGKNNELMTFDAKRLDINGPLRILAGLHTKVNNPSQDSTYFGVEGQRIGAFSENNAPSYFENTFNESKTLTELLQKMPQLNDVYSRGSEILKPGGLFFDKDGNRISEIKVEYIQGSKNELTGKNKSTAKLGLGERFVQEINQNINGKYYVLIPGDSSTEWMMNLGNVISMDDVLEGNHWDKIYTIYNNYLIDDIKLAQEDRKQNLYTRAKSQELRIMKDILPQDIVEAIEKMIKDEDSFDKIEKYIVKNRTKIDNHIKNFVEDISKETIDTLVSSNQISMVGEDEYYLTKFDTEFLKKYKLDGKVTFDEVLNFINFVNINYEINNQEYHKVLFGDPYQFKTEKGKLDETKRIKSFLSGRRRTFDTPEYNNFLKRQYNSVGDIKLDAKAPGYHNYKSYTKTITFSNIDIVGSIAMMPNIPKEIKEKYAKTDESDAMSWLMDNTHKEIALKEGQWTTQAEAFHQWHMAYTRRAYDARKDITWTYGDNTELKAKDAALLKFDMPKHKLAVRKPIISGNKADKKEIDLVLDKTSQMPLYYHMVEGTSLQKMYDNMFNQNIGYSIVVSGRKVGAQDLHNVYDGNGDFNNSEYGENNIVEVPWKIYGTQVETMTEGEKTQTRGSQLTKLSTVDLYENGEEIGATPERKEVIKNAVERNTKALRLLNLNEYNELLNKIGVVDLGDGYALEDNKRISETLMYEMMRRELSENAKDTIQLNEDGQFSMPFEASPSYFQIKSILYSLVNKALISPSMSGAPHVQAPVTMFEKATEGRSLARKTDEGWVKITKAQYAALTEEEKKDVMLTDDTLKFYEDEDGKRYCEVMLPHWFKDKFGKKTDEQILEYLKTDEGKKILTGIGFRIPTQALSSVEVFRVKGFLPQYMGSTVIVPSEITTKAGSDFDIDKLNMYLKSIYTDVNGDVRLVTYKGSEQATKAFYGKVYEDTIQKEINKIEKYDDFRSTTIDVLRIIESASAQSIADIDSLMTNDQIDFYNYHSKLLQNIIEQASEKNLSPSEYIVNQQENLNANKDKLSLDQLNQQLKNDYANTMYKKSLENEYYDSLEELLTLKENFVKLITPIDDAGLEKMSELLDNKRGYTESKVKGRLINRNYMTKMRHGFITAKRWVGIAAVNITSLSLRQKAKVYLDPAKLSTLSEQDRRFIEDLDIILPHNRIDVNGKSYVSLSGTTTADGKQLISNRLSGYATAFVDIANNPFITKIVKSDVVVSTFMFLESIGAANEGILFLNQPIIEKYLEYLDNTGSKSVANKGNIGYIKSLFPTTEKALEDAAISVEQLLDNIEDYGKTGELSALKNAEQHLILNEFIKYKILADQLFSYTQAVNYDTTRFGSSDALLKKEWGTFNASNFNLISNVNDVLGNTFIGEQAELLSKSFGSFGAIMKTELPEIKAYTISTLKKYATRKYMSADDYEKIANLIKNSFVDYVIQNNTTMSDMIKPLLVDSETAVVNQLEQAKQKYPSVQILQDLVPVPGNRDGSAKSIELKANVKDTYNENLYTGMMRELRDSGPELNALYNNIVNVAILQGTGQSAISIRNIIPVEDYAAKIAPIIEQLRADKSLKAFENGMFERNNFTNTDVFTEFRPYVHTPQPNAYTGEYNEKSVRMNPNTGEDELIYFLPNFKSMKGVTQTSRKLIVLNDTFNSFQLSSDFLKIPKVVTNVEGKKINITTGLEITKKDYAIMKQKGSQDLYNAYYYKKVYTNNVDEFGNRIPLKIYNADPKVKGYDYYYKQINVYGDGNRAVEINTDFTPSAIDNGGMPIQEELKDDDIVNAFSAQGQEEVAPTSLPTEVLVSSVSEEEEILLSPKDTESVLLKMGAKKVSKGQLNIDGQYWYLNKDNWNTMSKVGRNELYIYPTPDQEIYVGEDASGNYKFTTDTEFYKKYIERNKPTQAATKQMAGEPKGVKVKDGIYVNQEALTKDEQLELFDYLKPFLEEQAARTLKGPAASKMIGLGLRWDYKSNNPGKEAMNIPDVINPGNKTKYGYYDSSINNQPLAPITPRFRELMQKATGVDMTNYDGAIINLYEPTSFISSHNDVDESRSAIGYPVIGINIGGTGNFSIESRDGSPKQLDLKAGAGYVFGVDGVNREVYHRTFAKPQDSFLPELITKLDGKSYEPGSYRITVTMRRVMPLEPGMPSKPAIVSTEAVTEETPERVTFNLQPDNKEKIASGQKTTTIRTQKEFEYIGLPVGATAKTNINGVEFNVTNRGLLTIGEAGGQEQILKSEGLTSAEEFKFPTSKSWFEGKGKMYVYDFSKPTEAEAPFMEQQLNRPSIFDLRNVQIGYTSGQRKALEEISTLIDRKGDGHYLLAGYAGTGKTTIAENIAKYAKQAGKAILVIAPTNKAAKVLNDKLKSTGVGSVASTIHKTIYGEPNDQGEWEKSSDIKNSVIIIDESSMIEKTLMADLLDSTKRKNNVLIFMGDSYQLQPVGEDSGLFQGKVQEVKNDKTELTEVKRQSLDSSILKVATVIRNDKKSYVPTESTEDFKVTRSKNEFVENFKQAVKANEDVAMIVATNNERLLMNKLAREAKFGEAAKNILNPGETIISIANSSDYSNSEVFNAKDVRGEPTKFDITFTDNFGKSSKYDIYLAFVVNNEGIEVPTLFLPNVDKPSIYHAQILKAARESSPGLYSALDGWMMNTKKGTKLSPAISIATYGYAITAHKSQGSQWKKVFVNQNYVAESWDAARWFYTAITRASDEVEVLPSSSNIQISNAEIDSKLNAIVQEGVESFDTIKDFSNVDKEQILTNFATKYKMTIDQAKLYINDALAENKEDVINKLKDCY
jgi:alkylated DNA repair dioxygenase AlkB